MIFIINDKIWQDIEVWHEKPRHKTLLYDIVSLAKTQCLKNITIKVIRSINEEKLNGMY